MQPRRGFSEPASPPRPGINQLHVGQLIDHGPSRHEFQSKGPPSYFVTLKTGHGVVTLWGKGLERAFADSKTKPKLDDLIGVREINYDPVALVVRKCVDGVVMPERQYDTPRPRWVVEKLEGFGQRRLPPMRSTAQPFFAVMPSRSRRNRAGDSSGRATTDLAAASTRHQAWRTAISGQPSPCVSDRTPS